MIHGCTPCGTESNNEKVDFTGTKGVITDSQGLGVAHLDKTRDNTIVTYTIKEDIPAVGYQSLGTDINVVVTFDANGYGTAPDSQSVVYGNTITKPENLSAEGYIFAGWFKEKSCENEWDFDKDTIKEDTVIYTKWIEFGEKEIATDVKKDEKVTGSKSHKSYRRFCRVYTVR